VAIAEASETDWHNLTKSARAALNRGTSEIAAVGGTAAEVPGKAAAFRAKFPNVGAPSPTALAKWWPSLTVARPEPEWVEPPGIRAVREAQEADERLRRDDPEELTGPRSLVHPL
jgi:hypothetical protein